jgi:hypothetical protein
MELARRVAEGEEVALSVRLFLTSLRDFASLREK